MPDTLHYLIRPRRAAPAARPSPVNPLTSLWRDLVGSWRHALARAHEPSLDDETLRDLGIARSELSSFRAEVDGLAPPTRLRTLQQRSW